MDTYGMDLMGRRRRRRHSSEFKAAVIQECMRPGVSMAAVALAHSLNANMHAARLNAQRERIVQRDRRRGPDPPRTKTDKQRVQQARRIGIHEMFELGCERIELGSILGLKHQDLSHLSRVTLDV